MCARPSPLELAKVKCKYANGKTVGVCDFLFVGKFNVLPYLSQFSPNYSCMSPFAAIVGPIEDAIAAIVGPIERTLSPPLWVP